MMYFHHHLAPNARYLKWLLTLIIHFNLAKNKNNTHEIVRYRPNWKLAEQNSRNSTSTYVSQFYGQEIEINAFLYEKRQMITIDTYLRSRKTLNDKVPLCSKVDIRHASTVAEVFAQELERGYNEGYEIGKV
ncbi:unnamed protein product [Adineta ricciae]|uniref:Uncharacterized protein n=1 Tax=Adineta ricciae TaxID=249248 RepID=A0A815ZKP3_ADIRI|nr:unnamed protein product [Adineta ricciae]